MVYAKYRLSDGQFLCVWPQRPDCDPATEGIQEFPQHLRPDLRAERYDAASATRKRPATAQELADYDDARTTSAAQRFVDTDPMFLAMGELIRREINDVRTSLPIPMPARTQQQIIDRFKTIYKAVLTQLNL